MVRWAGPGRERMCRESRVCHLLTSWIHKYLESGLVGPLGPGSKIGPKCSEIGCCQPKLRSMNPQMRFPSFFLSLSSAYHPPCVLYIMYPSYLSRGGFSNMHHWKKKQKQNTGRLRNIACMTCTKSRLSVFFCFFFVLFILWMDRGLCPCLGQL